MTRLLPRSLHARMLVLSVAATLVALALAGWAITGVLEQFVTRGLDQRLDAEVSLLAGTIDVDGHVNRDLLRQRLGALESGPEWRWRIVAPGGTIGSADFPPLDDGPAPPLAAPAPPPASGEPAHPPPPPPGVHPGDGPPADAPDRLHALDGGHEHGVRVHARQLTIRTRGGPVILTAAAPRAVIRRPVRAALMPLVGALGVLAVLLAGATFLQLRWGMRPVRRLRDEVAAIRAGAQQRVDEDQPTELRPLAVELNQLAADNEAALGTARRSAANLAHALKTPVATLALALRDQPGPAAQVARIDATIRHHLARARVAAIDRRAATPLAPAVAGLVDAIRRLHRGRALTIEADVAATLTVAVDAQDLDELVGNLLDNAARHAVGQVSLRAAADPADPRRVAIVIRDDGPGIPAAARALVAQPGMRLDERGDGHGFGLAIVTELAGLYGGGVALDDAPGGGLAVTLTLPAVAGAG